MVTIRLTRIGTRIHGVPEPREALPRTQNRTYGTRRADVECAIEKIDGYAARSPVQLPAQDGKPSADHGIRIGPCGGGDAHAEGGRSQFVIGQQHERSVERSEHPRHRTPRCEPSPESTGDGRSNWLAASGQHETRRSGVTDWWE